MIRSNLCHCSEAYIYVIGLIIILNTGTAAAPNNVDKNILFKKLCSITNCIIETNNIQVGDVHIFYLVMEYSNICSKILGRIWQ